MNESFQKVVARGHWMYAGVTEKPVYVIEQNYDYWFEMEKADGDIEAGEKSELNEDGLVYYVRFASLERKPWGVESSGYKTIEEAKVCAREKANGPVRWD